jgi:hypothetical protein
MTQSADVNYFRGRVDNFASNNSNSVPSSPAPIDTLAEEMGFTVTPSTVSNTSNDNSDSSSLPLEPLSFRSDEDDKQDPKIEVVDE